MNLSRSLAILRFFAVFAQSARKMAQLYSKIKSWCFLLQTFFELIIYCQQSFDAVWP
jgi:hypothetical protein